MFLSTTRFRLMGPALAVSGATAVVWYAASADVWTSLTILVTPPALVIAAAEPTWALCGLIVATALLDTRLRIAIGPGVPDLSLNRFIFVALMIVVFVRTLRGRIPSIARPNLTDVMAVLTLIVVVVSLPRVTTTTEAEQIVGRLCVPLVVYLLTRELVTTTRSVHLLLWSVMGLGMVLGVYAIGEALTRRVLIPRYPGQDVSNLQTYFVGPDGPWMIRGVLGRSGHFARLLLVSIPVSIYLLDRSARRPLHMTVLLAALGAQVGALFFTFSRTAWIVGAAELLVLSCAMSSRTARRFAVATFVVVVSFWTPALGILGGSAADVSTVNVARRAETPAEAAARVDGDRQGSIAERVTFRLGTLNGRLPRWRAGAQMWAEKPAFGWGFGSRVERQRANANQWPYWAVESDYLHMLIGVGLVGFLPYLLFLLTPLVFSLRIGLRSRRDGWPDSLNLPLLAAYWCVIAAFLATSAMVVQTRAVVQLTVFSLVAAIVARHDRPIELTGRARSWLDYRQAPRRG